MKSFFIACIAVLLSLTLTAQSIDSCVNTSDRKKKDLSIDTEPLIQFINERKHKEGIELCLDYLTIDPKNEMASGQLADFLYNMAEIESGNKDPYVVRNMLYIDDAGASDSIGYEIEMMKYQIGPNYWSREAIQKYGDLSLCLIKCHRRKLPRFSGYYSRYLTTLLAMKQFDQVIEEMKLNGSNKIDSSVPIGNFYANFTERYLGYDEIGKGLEYLLNVIDTYEVHPSHKEYWRTIFDRVISDSSLPEVEKTNLKKKAKLINS